MNQRVLSILVALCVIAGTCALWYYQNSGRSMQTAKPLPTMQTVTADSAIQPAPATASSIANLEGKAVQLKRHLSAVAEHFYDAEDSQNMATPPGIQAFAMRLEESLDVSHLVPPGMSVDILVSTHPPGGDAKHGSVTKTFLHNIQVLSTASYTQKDSQGKPQQFEVLNLRLTPEQAIALSQVGTQSGILLVLRDPESGQIYQLSATAMNGSVQDRQPLVATSIKRIRPERIVSPGSYYTVQIINGSRAGGSKISTVVFPLAEGVH